MPLCESEDVVRQNGALMARFVPSSAILAPKAWPPETDAAVG